MMDDNIKTPQDALAWLDRSIREEAELDGEMSNAHAIQIGFIQNMLAKFPRRNCEVGTPKEQAVRFTKFCYKHRSLKDCGGCPLIGESCCELAWAQMPYVEKEGERA